MCGVCSIGRSPDMAFAATASRRTRLQTVVPLSTPSDSAFGAGSASTLLQQGGEPCLLEVAVAGGCLGDSFVAHDHKRDAVGQ